MRNISWAPLICLGLCLALSIHIFAKALQHHCMVGIVIFTGQKTDSERCGNMHQWYSPDWSPAWVLVRSLYAHYFICSTQTWYVTVHWVQRHRGHIFFFSGAYIILQNLRKNSIGLLYNIKHGHITQLNTNTHEFLRWKNSVDISCFGELHHRIAWGPRGAFVLSSTNRGTPEEEFEKHWTTPPSKVSVFWIHSSTPRWVLVILVMIQPESSQTKCLLKTMSVHSCLEELLQELLEEGNSNFYLTSWWSSTSYHYLYTGAEWKNVKNFREGLSQGGQGLAFGITVGYAVITGDGVCLATYQDP